MKKILCIDDDPDILAGYETGLVSGGYEVVTTTNQDKGLKLVQEEQDLALVILDIMMPGKDGFEVYREFRSLRKLPALFITGHPKSFNAPSDTVRNIWQNEFADGTTDVLYKPIEVPELLQKVEGLIGPAEDDV